jgi:23S rRNA (cytidine1920-2'-O)/16S rRNA (cytidine1409-2'-O)-methyltransferase
LAPTREEARQAIEAGLVLVGGVVADKAARQVSAAEPVALTGPPRRFVGRGGEKLLAALQGFQLDVSGRCALDVGASTGGFTDCLLQRGAGHVVSVDVGYGQLHERLRADPRVTSRERQDIRTFEHAPFDLVVADVSFISLRSVAPHIVARLAAPGADVVALIKPQFEAGRAVVSRGRGVVRDPGAWLTAVSAVRSAMEAEGAAMMDVMVSPLKGAGGNVEFLAHLVAHAGAPGPEIDLGSLIDGVAGQA